MASGGLTSDVAAMNAALVESWTLSLHDKAPRTVTHYLDEVRRFANWLAEHSRPGSAPGDLLAVERRDVEAWLMAQRTAGIAQATMRNRCLALRNLYGWALAEGEIERSPLERVVVAKASSPAPDVLADEELKLLLKACAGSDFYARRDLALIRFMLATGLRVSETVDLVLGDLELTNRLAFVPTARATRLGPCASTRRPQQRSTGTSGFERVTPTHLCHGCGSASAAG